MALSINWATRVIYVPQADLTPLGGSRYRLDVDDFRLELKDIEDSEDGIAFPDTHRHSTEVTLSGVTYSRQVEIINGYTVEFQNGTYQVECVGANHNLGDVKVVNSVSLVIGNSAGLITVVSGSGVTAQDKEDIAAEVRVALDAELERVTRLWRRLGLDPANPLVTNENAGTITAGNVSQTAVESPPGVVTITQAP